MRPPCTFPNCGRPTNGHGLCSSHTAQRRRGISLRAIPPKRTPEERYWSFVAKTDNCWLWTGGKDQKGYGGFMGMKAHRFGWQLQNGPIPPGLLCCHHCDNPSCVRPDHLFIGTPKDNSQDMVAKGRVQRACRGRVGMAAYNSRLTDDNVREIRLLLASGLSFTKIGRRFGVTKMPIQDIAHRRRWTHVT